MPVKPFSSSKSWMMPAAAPTEAGSGPVRLLSETLRAARKGLFVVVFVVCMRVRERVDVVVNSFWRVRVNRPAAAASAKTGKQVRESRATTNTTTRIRVERVRQRAGQLVAVEDEAPEAGVATQEGRQAAREVVLKRGEGGALLLLVARGEGG